MNNRRKQLLAEQNLKIVISHLIKEELDASFIENQLVPPLVQNFEHQGYELRNTIHHELAQMKRTKNSKSFLNAIGRVVDEEFFTNKQFKDMKNVLVQKIAEKILAFYKEPESTDARWRLKNID